MSALCLRDEGNKLHLVTPSNREVNLSPKRALLVSRSSLTALHPREEILRWLKQAEERRAKLKEQVRVRELWELLKDEEECYDYTFLAQLCFGEEVSDDHVSALVRALFEDKLHFRMKDIQFLPNSQERVEQFQRQAEEEAKKEEILMQGSAWLKSAIEKKAIEPPPCRQEIIDTLIDLALYGEDASRIKFGKELLQRAGISNIEEARGILVSLGIWEEDENLDLYRFKINTVFTEEEIGESEQLVKRGFFLPDGKREDLRDLPVFTVDGASTRDFDDALSFEIREGCFHLGIHIADVASVISPESILDKGSFLRGSSLYLPRHQIPMMPPNLSQDMLSLIQGLDRPAISLLARLDMEGRLLEYRFVPSIIRVHQQLTYDTMNDLIIHDPLMGDLSRLSQRLHQKRRDQGALILSLPEVIVQFNPDASFSLLMLDQDTPSRMMVAELMILYNWLAARFCRDNQIPSLYRTQEPPSEFIPLEEGNYAFYVFKQRRKLHPLFLDTEPRPHNSLGVDVYTNVSSPIRRYFDLIIQRQIGRFLLHGDFEYSKEDLEKKRTLLEPFLKDLEKLKRNRLRYWILKYLSLRKGESFQALVLDMMKNRYRLLLPDFLMTVEMKRHNGQNFGEGQSIRVKIQESNPWSDTLRVEYLQH